MISGSGYCASFKVELLNGKKFSQLSSAAYKFLDKVDAAAFDKP